MERKLFISPSPHLTDADSIQKIMIAVIIALLPAGAGAVYFFGSRVVLVIGVTLLSVLLTELGANLLLKRPVSIQDGSAVITGILLAYNLPAEVPLWLPAAGGFVSIAIGKMVFGGLGFNPLNPALIGRAFLMASWPVHMTVFKTLPRGGTLSGIDVMTGATPLGAFKAARQVLISTSSFSTDQLTEAAQTVSKLYSSHSQLFFGRVGGCIGETSAVLLLLGAVFLMYRRVIGWKIPFTFVGTVALLSWIFGGTDGLFTGDALFHILSGGLILGAFYMATDMVTSPITFKGRLIFGCGCGILTVIIRLYGGYPEGVSYSILLMNLTVPLLDRFTKPKTFGGR